MLDDAIDRPVYGARVILRATAGEGPGKILEVETAADGAYRFDSLAPGRYVLSVVRFGYRTATIEVTLDRFEPLFAAVRLVPVPFPVASIDLRVPAHPGPSLSLPPVPGAGGAAEARAASERALLGRALSSDARHLSHDDVREANTLAEDDLFRAIQRLPGVGTRDGYSADLWSRGAPAGQTAVLFDGIPIMGALHALGGLSGLNTDMLSAASFQPGVVSASLQGGGAALVGVTSRSGLAAATAGGATISPLSVRASMHGSAGGRIGWAVGARRSHVDILSRAATRTGLLTAPIPYVFRDVTARLDAVLDERHRLETSAFWQDDRISGDVRRVAYGNAGHWGLLVARGSLVGRYRGGRVRHTFGVSEFAVSLDEAPTEGEARTPLHPGTDSRYRILLLESRVDARIGSLADWSAGFRTTREIHEYRGPGIDLARLLSREELERRGLGDLTPIIERLRRAEDLRSEAMTRLAFWGEGRWHPGPDLDVEAGVRIESGSPVGDDRVRLAPRARVRWQPAGAPYSLTAAGGRAFQYVQSTARTDVLRTGLRASEVLVQAGTADPAIRSDVATLGGEAWVGPSVVFGATGWLRASSGVLVPDPTPGVIDAPREVMAAEGRARGVELSLRKPAGPVRGFVNYTWSRARYRVGSREFGASEDRRHMANAGVTTELSSGWTLGATATAQSGAPYTRITLVDAECDFGNRCSGPPPVLYGAPGLQRSGAYVTLDLRAERTFHYSDWSLTVYGQVGNALGRRNAVSYHSSCICAPGPGVSAGLHDRFDEGLPRLPLIGLRARF